MKVAINSPEQLGAVIRATRKRQGLRQDLSASGAGVSENFLGKVERGSDSVQWGKLFSVLQGLGIELEVDTPDDIAWPPE